MQTAEYIGQVVFDVLRNDFHRPFVEGKANRDKIEDNITIGILAGELQPMDQSDVDMICDLVDGLIEEHGTKQ